VHAIRDQPWRTRVHWALVAVCVVVGAISACGTVAPAAKPPTDADAEYQAAGPGKTTGDWRNRLVHAASPYLVMHANDPVNWYPWGDEAFAEAKRRNIPVFLSIGYYACHWCHVMHHESFQDPTVAAYMNANFVSIKVDREERPDVDALYMDAVHIINRHGGWPASIWLTPQRLPFFAGTYFPPKSRHGRTGFMDVLTQITDDWRNKPAEIDKFATRIRARLAQRAAPEGGGQVPPGVAVTAARNLVNRWDTTRRGWGSRRQFPMTANLEFLLHHGTVHGNDAALDVVRGQLEAMDEGGIHDHLGGGFHRYTVDAQWQIPHFEKMLYDNGQLLSVYAEASVVMDNPRFAQVARDIADYLIRQMQGKNGAFYSSQSADSEGEEGTFYVWTPAQVREVVPDAAPFLAAYGVTERGNFEGRRTVLTRLSGDPEAPQMAAARAALMAQRATREHPPTDDKFVVAWNGLTITGMARAGRLLGEPRYTAAAGAAARAVLSKRSAKGQLPRTLGPNAPPGVLEDYAFMAEGLLDLWEADPDPTWLAAADEIAAQMIERFFDPNTGAMYQAEAQTDLLVRRTDATDGAEPSGPGRALSALFRLRALGGTSGRIDVIDKTLENAHWVLDRSPDNASSLSEVADRIERGSREVVIATSDLDAPALALFLDTFNAKLRPDTVLAVLTPATSPKLTGFSATLGKEPAATGPRAFVCRNGVCRQPTDSPEVFRRELERPWK
jgi:uncharacterized protein YyaL (SSP411 family)